MTETKEKPVRITSHGGEDGHVKLEALTGVEMERFQGTLLGHWWMRGNEGRLEFAPAHLYPNPTDDTKVPEWRMTAEEGVVGEYQSVLFDSARRRESWISPSLTIQHLCGYHYTKEAYKEYADVLERYGFACLRSRRGDDGRFHEHWFLPGLWCAKGTLKEKLARVEKDAQLDVAIEFLCKTVQFGTLDVSLQRAAMVIDD